MALSINPEVQSSLPSGVPEKKEIKNKIVETAIEKLPDQQKDTGANPLKRVVVYFSDWSMYNSLHPTFANQLPTDCITDVHYAFGNVANDGTITLADPWADIQYGENWQNPNEFPYWGNLQMLHQVKLKAQSEGKEFRSLFSVGGWGHDGPLAATAASSTARQNFINCAINMCDTYNLDGIDIDWEYPVGGNNPENFLIFMQEISAAFAAHVPPLMLTIATAAGPDNFQGIDWQQVSQYVNRIDIMTYDYHGPWGPPSDVVTNHQAPIKQTMQGDPNFNITATIQGYSNAVADMSEVCIGIPLYFRTYAGATAGETPSHLYSPYNGPGSGEPGAPGIKLYRDVMQDVAQGTNGASGSWDSLAEAYSVYYNQTQEFATGVNTQATNLIAATIKTNNLSGAMFWEFIGDDANSSAIRSVYTALNGASATPVQPPIANAPINCEAERLHRQASRAYFLTGKIPEDLIEKIGPEMAERISASSQRYLDNKLPGLPVVQ